MKNSILIAFTAFLFMCNNSFAQPSDAQIKSRVLNHGAKSVEFYGTGKVHNTLTETYYIRSFVASYATEYPGVTQKVSTEYKYNKNGGSWSFTKEFIVEVVYDGIPNPTEEELLSMINSDKKEFLGGSYTDIVGEVESIKLAQEPHWMWHSVSSVSVDMEAIYSKKMSSTEISKVKQIHTVRLYSDGFKQPWNKFKGSKKGYPEIISTQTYSAEEIRNMKTLYDIELDNEAEAIMSGLPTITIPEFRNTKEVIVHTFKMLREATHDEFKSYLYEMLSSDFFHGEQSKVLNSYGERLFEDMEPIFNPNTAFKDQYCEHPKVKTDGETSMEFWNKAMDRYTRINVKKHNGSFKITAISAYVFVKSEDANRLRSMGTENCGEPVQTEVEEVATYAVGESCKVYVRGYGWINATISQKDTNFDNRYLVKDENGKSAWYTTESLQKTTQTVESTPTPTSTSTNNSTQESSEEKEQNTSNQENSKTTNSDTNSSKEDNNPKEQEKKEQKVDVNKTKTKVNNLKNKKIKIGG